MEGAADSLRHSAGDSASTLTTFPLPARRAERADFPRSALVRDYPFAHSELGVCTVRRGSAMAFHRNSSGQRTYFPVSTFVLPTQPLARSLRRMGVDHPVGRTDLAAGHGIRETPTVPQGHGSAGLVRVGQQPWAVHQPLCRVPGRRPRYRPRVVCQISRSRRYGLESECSVMNRKGHAPIRQGWRVPEECCR